MAEVLPWDKSQQVKKLQLFAPEAFQAADLK
jgi:hypothetical protein